MREGGSRLLRRLPLLVVLAALAWLFLGDRPRELDLVYDLPDDPAPVRASVRISDREGRVPASIEWGTGDGPARDRQPHAARLAPGDYRLEARLVFADGRTRDVTRELAVGRDDRRIVVHLR